MLVSFYIYFLLRYLLQVIKLKKYSFVSMEHEPPLMTDLSDKQQALLL